MIEFDIIKKEVINGKITYSLTENGVRLRDLLLNLNNWFKDSGCKIPKECKNRDHICELVFRTKCKQK